MSSTSQYDTKLKSACTVALASAFVLVFTVGCSSKNYVRSQTAPIIQQTNDLDTKTAADHRNIQDTDERAKTGIAGAQSAASTAELASVGISAAASGSSGSRSLMRDVPAGSMATLTFSCSTVSRDKTGSPRCAV